MVLYYTILFDYTTFSICVIHTETIQIDNEKHVKWLNNESLTNNNNSVQISCSKCDIYVIVPLLNYSLIPIGYRSSGSTTLNMAKVNFQDVRSSGFREFITVSGDDLDDGEQKIFRLVGVAPGFAVQGDAAVTYEGKVGKTVPVYSELDDGGFSRFASSRPNFFSAHVDPGQSLDVPAKGLISGNTFVVLLIN